MAIVVDVGDAIDLARQLKLPVSRERAAIERSMASIGLKLARKLRVRMSDAYVDTSAFGGACISFVQKKGGATACPRALQELDIDGELAIGGET